MWFLNIDNRDREFFQDIIFSHQFAKVPLYNHELYSSIRIRQFYGVEWDIQLCRLCIFSKWWYIYIPVLQVNSEHLIILKCPVGLFVTMHLDRSVCLFGSYKQQDFYIISFYMNGIFPMNAAAEKCSKDSQNKMKRLAFLLNNIDLTFWVWMLKLQSHFKVNNTLWNLKMY